MPATPALNARATEAGLTVRGQSHGRTVHTVSLQGDRVPELTDAELLTIAGLNETRHHGGRVTRWPADPTVATVDLFTD